MAWLSTRPLAEVEGRGLRAEPAVPVREAGVPNLPAALGWQVAALAGVRLVALQAALAHTEEAPECPATWLLPGSACGAALVRPAARTRALPTEEQEQAHCSVVAQEEAAVRPLRRIAQALPLMAELAALGAR